MATDHAACKGCLNRRMFLGGIAGMAGAAGMAGMGHGWAIAAPPPASAGKPRIRLIFSHHRVDAQGKQSEPGWPYLGYDCEGRKHALLAKLQQGCPGIEFLPTTAFSAEDARKLLEADKTHPVDGYLAYMIGGWATAGQTIAAAGKPVIYVGDLYGASGEILTAISEARRQNFRAFGVTSSRFEDVVDALRCFETIKKLKASNIVDVGAGPGELGKAIHDVFGTTVVPVDFPEINAAYAKADPAQAHQWADKWIREAEKVGPARAEIEKSGAMFVAMRSLMERYQAQAITINCLGGFYSGHMQAYPCLGHFQLNNDGLVGACEADLQSTITMLAMGYLVGKPGYISDPVVDTATNRIIYIHCVGTNKVFGPDGPTNPYQILSHAEDRKGAALRSLMPLGQPITTLQTAPTRREMIIHQGKTCANVDDDRSCRTKLAAEVKGDVNKLLGQWDRWGWHRVTFFGDHKRAVEQLATLVGLKMVEEA